MPQGSVIQITDRVGAAVCAEAPIATSATGTYSCTVKTGAQTPFVLVVTDPSDTVAPLISLLADAPAANTASVFNVSQLTNAIAAKLSPSGDPSVLATSPAALIANVDKAKLDAQTATLVAQIQPVLAANGVPSPATFNPMTTAFVADRASAVDKSLDQLTVVLVNGAPAITNPLAPDAAPVAIAAAGTPNPPVAAVAQYQFNIADLDFSKTMLEKCFVRPVAERVIAKDDTLVASAGGRDVTQMHPDCAQLARPDFLQSGYRFGQLMYSTLTSDAMTGAKFNLPELMRYSKDATTGTERAVINQKYRDANGFASNFIMVVQRYPGEAGMRGSEWFWLGNGRPIDAFLRPFVIKREQFSTLPTAGSSRYESGLEIFVTVTGPGSVRASDGAVIRAARVKGPGLPTAGLVFGRLDPSILSNQTWMEIVNKTGAVPDVLTTVNNGNLYRLQRVTLGGAAQANPVGSVVWAEATDTGGTLPNTATLTPFTQYTFEIFYGADTTPSLTVTPSIVAAAQPASVGLAQQWNSFTDAVKGYMDPAGPLAAATSSFNYAWTLNPFAEPIRSVGAYTGSRPNGTSAFQIVNNGTVGVALGSTSATVNSPVAGVLFPALTADANSYRIFQLRYQRLDGSYKDSTIRYN
ncbi:MAG: hypothetical protein ACRCV9_16680 [Burkholderiaceae bacterium]